MGNAWAAFFNWLFARRHGGRVVLRIEDTDPTRSSPEYERAIYEDLRWLGIDWDEGPDVGGPYGPYRQSQRGQLYREALDMLLRSGAAYPCYCSPEEIEAERRRAQAEGRSYRYSRRCRTRSEAEVRALQNEGRKPAFRLDVGRFEDGKLAAPGGWLQLRREDGRNRLYVVVHDLIRGEVAFALDELDDFIVVRSDGTALYNFANVVDDHGMRITHVLRAVEHLSNTPRQVLLYRALGWEMPQFAHLPVLVGPDRKKLSKRHGDTALREYRDELYLPEALCNFFALMAWYPEDGREIFSIEELVQRFDLSQVGRASPVFDRQKLLWMNGEYLRMALRENPQRVANLVADYLVRHGLLPESPSEMQRAYVRRVVQVLGERLKEGADVLRYGDFFFLELPRYEPAAVEAHLKSPQAAEALALARAVAEQVEPFQAQHLEAAVRAAAAEKGLPMRAVVHPVRVALTGKTVGPGLFELMEVLGREQVLRRLQHAAELVTQAPV